MLALSVPAVTLGAVQLTSTLTGTLGDNDWYTSAVTVKWTASGETSTTGCDTQYLTADTAGTEITCKASAPGEEVSHTITVHVDQTPPTAVVATPARPPDAGLSYSAPLPISWSATDVTSGIAACTTLTYAGPDGPAVAPTGTCRDRAGNVSAPLPFSFSYDTTVPVLPDPIVAATGVPTASQATVTGTPSPPTAKPKAERPTLTWRAQPKAKYYNLQLFRNGRKVLSTWPTVTHYTLKPSWRYRGHTYTLTAGRYRWYVWPGYGPRAAHRYGKLLSKGAVTVPRS